MNWEQVALSKVIRLTNGKSISSDYSENRTNEYVYPVYGGNSILGYSRNYLIDYQTLVIGRVGEYCGNVNLVDGRIWVSDNALYISEWLRRCDNTFLYYLLTYIDFNRYSDATGQPKITQSLLKRIKPQIPQNREEQTAIATILTKVDNVIQATNNSIKAADKLKKALMQNLLTGKLKPDGTWRKEDEFYEDEKFGKVPKGWRVKAVKNVFHVNQESLPSKTNPEYEFNYITIEAVSTEFIAYKGCPTYKFKEAPGRARRKINNGDILISGVRPNLKAFAIYNNPNNLDWICSTGFYVLTAKEKENNQFYFYQILSEIGESQFHSYVAGTNYPAIGDSDIKKMKLLAPQYEEQCIIAESFQKLSKEVNRKKSKIKSLQRLKESLMQHLLTGKVRVDVEKVNEVLKAVDQ
ncbi:MAG: hypothetical protein DHS20C17_14300 [Cyclobacteriaceae bacterium]|nr:MAG: hypothetical protein DHS20C17_14300 [Cyclobacteriaceae bacterium]